MNAIAQFNVQTMSSREIAELTGKEHKNVKRDCITMFNELNLDVLKFERTYLDVQNRSQTEYLLTKELVETLITGYNIKLRHAVIQRLHELEQQAVQSINPMKVFSDPVAMRSLLLGYTEKVIELEHQVIEMKSDVEAFDRIATADGSLCVTDAAKALQVTPKFLFSWLSQNHWIYKRTGSAHYVGYQDKVQSGYLEHKVTEVTRSDGTAKITEQVRITPKGLTKLSKLLGSNND